MNHKTYILVHGAWHNSWCWHKLIPLLQKTNHSVLAPDLPGHGANKDIPYKSIHLRNYVDSICNLIKKQSNQVILVGHSMSGVIVSQVAENLAHRINHLVYLCALVPNNQESILNIKSQTTIPGISANNIMVNAAHTEITLKMSVNDAKKYFYNNCKPQDIASAMHHLQKQPYLPFFDQVTLTNKFDKIPKTYITCLQDKVLHLADQKTMHSKVACKIIQLDTDHSPFLSMPTKLADLLTVI